MNTKILIKQLKKATENKLFYWIEGREKEEEISFTYGVVKIS